MGCASGPKPDKQTKEPYRIGTTQQEIHSILEDALLVTSAKRPESGWSNVGDRHYDAELMAFNFERSHPGATVQTLEVYWITRNLNTPSASGGIWFDYLFFGSQNKLLGYHRKFLE